MVDSRLSLWCLQCVFYELEDVVRGVLNAFLKPSEMAVWELNHDGDSVANDDTESGDIFVN